MDPVWTRMPRTALAASLSVAGLAVGLWSCTSQPPPNLLLITIDTLRSDHMSVYGYRRPTTPQIARFAEEGVRFDLAYAPAATTGPSHATLFTGRYPISHGVVKNGLPLDSQLTTLAEILSDAGYQTAGIVSSFVLDAKFGYDQGFESYDDDFEQGESSIGYMEWWGHKVDVFDRRADTTTSATLRWLEEARDPERPFFLWVHYFDPHAPYTPPGSFGMRFAEEIPKDDALAHKVQLYDAEITYTDLKVGELLRAIETRGLADSTLVALTSDHGEGLMDHGIMLHGVHVYEELVRIPLILRWPQRLPAGRTISEPVELLDLAPTLLSLIGIDASPYAYQGRDLSAALLGTGAIDPRHSVFLHRRHYEGGLVEGVRVRGEKYGVRKGRWKFIDGPEEGTRELYDLSADPEERSNRYYEDPETARQLHALLGEWRETYAAEGTDAELSESDRRALEALGYVE